MEDFIIECDECDAETLYSEAYANEAGTYCEDCHEAWMDKMARQAPIDARLGMYAPRP